MDDCRRSGISVIGVGRRCVGGLLLGLALWFFIWPGLTVVWYLMTDKGLHGEGVSSFAYSRHRALSDNYGEYCRSRIGSGKAESLSVHQIAETEWPLFGSAFYLWATESLQRAWENDPALSKEAPKVYAREAIDAAKDLVLDPGHAKWVKDHWGQDHYLERENVFYRMLVISVIVSHHNLTGSEEHFELLREQSDGLMKELDASAHGVLDDYPGQCYPIDVVAAIGAIQRADQVLGERGVDHSEMIQRSLRAFSGEMAGSYGLPAYAQDSVSGSRFDNSRGCSNSFFTTVAPAIWPDQDPGWYSIYTHHFWQENGFAAGFREFSYEEQGVQERGDVFYEDVDAGPVFGGLGTAATAFGIGAARVNGHFGHASTLSYQMLAASWPLPNGTLMFPRLFSNGDHAPYLGEVSILFQLSCEPVHDGRAVRERGRIPGCVWLMLVGYALLAWVSVRIGWRVMGPPRQAKGVSESRGRGEDGP